MRHAQGMVSVRYVAIYPADVSFVMASLTSETFLAEYAAEVGALESDVSVEKVATDARTQVRMTVPTTGVPAPFTKLVTPTVEIVERRQWRAIGAAPRSTGSVTVEAAVGRRSARVSGGLEVAPVAGGARFSVDGTITVNLRLLGDVAASLIRDLVGNVLKQQEKVMRRWIDA